jgi:cell division protein FtsW
MPITQRFDRFLLGATILQTAVGLALLVSASWVIATERYHRPGSYFFTWQAGTGVIGLVLLLACMHLRLDLIGDRRVAVAALGGTWILLGLTFLQPEVASTHRWLSAGGISVQPSVLARLAVILFAAAELELARREGWPVQRLLAVGAAVAGTATLIVLEPDLGSAALMVIVLGGMAFAAGAPIRLLSLPAAAGLAALAIAIISSPYRLERVRVFLSGSTEAAAGWQSLQSLVALGSGGLVGRGYSQGVQKLFFLPEPHTDFIFACTGEELGLLGVLALIVLAAIITWRGLRIAARQEVPRRALLAFGLTLAFAVQTLIHMMVCLDMLPPKGIPLPLVSYGKTDLVVTLASMGLLLNLSREVSS